MMVWRDYESCASSKRPNNRSISTKRLYWPRLHFLGRRMKDEGTIAHEAVGMTGQRPKLLDERLFKQAITRERKRADRSGLAMVLLLVGLPNGSGEQGKADDAVVTNALSAVASEPDIVGWFESSHVIGLIVSEIDPVGLTGTCDRLESSVLSAIALQGDEGLAQHLS